MYATCLGLLTMSAFKWPLVLMYPFVTGTTGMPVLPLMAVGCQLGFVKRPKQGEVTFR